MFSIFSGFPFDDKNKSSPNTSTITSTSKQQQRRTKEGEAVASKHKKQQQKKTNRFNPIASSNQFLLPFILLLLLANTIRPYHRQR